jgi:hypothetical protein
MSLLSHADKMDRTRKGKEDAIVERKNIPKDCPGLCLMFLPVPASCLS